MDEYDLGAEALAFARQRVTATGVKSTYSGGRRMATQQRRSRHRPALVLEAAAWMRVTYIRGYSSCLDTFIRKPFHDEAMKIRTRSNSLLFTKPG